MHVIYYPDRENLLDKSGSIGRVFKNLQQKRPDLWALTRSIIMEVEDSPDLEKWKRQGYIKKIHSDFPIFEFKIPPKKQGGVVRLYFARKKNNPNSIIILSAELKRQSKASPEKIKQAETRYQEVCL